MLRISLIFDIKIFDIKTFKGKFNLLGETIFKIWHRRSNCPGNSQVKGPTMHNTLESD
tara:strand:- start:4359 stop:4532 length:174 start_codon:yes stop_codon:yes gene_type:complete